MKVEGKSLPMIQFSVQYKKKKKKRERESIILGVSVLIVITVPFLSGAGFNYKASPLLVCGSRHHLFPIVSIKEECLQ